MKRVLFFLGHLNDRDVEWMIQNGEKLELHSGDLIIEKGQTVDSLYIVLSGELTIYSDSSFQNSIAKLGSGEVVGEMSFLESRPPSVCVLVTQSAEVFKISRKSIETRMSTNPDFKASFYYSLALFLSNRLRKTTDQLGYGTAEEEDLIDINVLDGVSKAGARFSQILHKFAAV